MEELVELILHTDDALLAIVSDNVARAYLILFLVIFCETGLILFPFLPGDGLLFSAGVVAASTDLNIYWLVLLLMIAATAGNLCNYFIGKFFGDKLEGSSKQFVQKHLVKYISQTRQFYNMYGGKSIIIGRFFPVVRTYIPFLAGVVDFPFQQFLTYTVTGFIIWVPCFALTGFFVGEILWVQNNYGLIFLGFIVLTALPFLFKLAQNVLQKRRLPKS